MLRQLLLIACCLAGACAPAPDAMNDTTLVIQSGKDDRITLDAFEIAPRGAPRTITVDVTSAITLTVSNRAAGGTEALLLVGPGGIHQFGAAGGDLVQHIPGNATSRTVDIRVFNTSSLYPFEGELKAEFGVRAEELTDAELTLNLGCLVPLL